MYAFALEPRIRCTLSDFWHSELLYSLTQRYSKAGILMSCWRMCIGSPEERCGNRSNACWLLLPWQKLTSQERTSLPGVISGMNDLGHLQRTHAAHKGVVDLALSPPDVLDTHLISSPKQSTNLDFERSTRSGMCAWFVLALRATVYSCTTHYFV